MTYRIFWAIVLLFLQPGLAAAQENVPLPPPGSLAIIVNADNNEEISQKEVKSIFLGRRTLWYKQKEAIAVVLQPKENAASLLFNRHFFSDTGRRLTRQWIKNVVIGAAPAPITLKQDVVVLEEVGENKSAIGYVVISKVSFAQDLTGVRIVLVFPEPEAP